jgi:hypothetical protein
LKNSGLLHLLGAGGEAAEEQHPARRLEAGDARVAVLEQGIAEIRYASDGKASRAIKRASPEIVVRRSSSLKPALA